MEPTYARSLDMITSQFNALNPRFIPLTTSTGLPSETDLATMTQVAACEYTGDSTRYPSRPALTFSAAAESTFRRVRALATITLPAHTTTPTFVRYAIVCDVPGGASGSATIGNTAGRLAYLSGASATGLPVTGVATNEIVITLAIELGGRSATFSA